MKRYAAIAAVMLCLVTIVAYLTIKPTVTAGCAPAKFRDGCTCRITPTGQAQMTCPHGIAWSTEAH
jgi:hypothetical protein